MIVCVIIFSCQPRSVRLFNGCALVKKMLQKLPYINRLLKELPNRICKEKYDARRRFPFSILCASVGLVCRSKMSPSFSFCHVEMLRQLPKTRHRGTCLRRPLGTRRPPRLFEKLESYCIKLASLITRYSVLINCAKEKNCKISSRNDLQTER